MSGDGGKITFGWQLDFVGDINIILFVGGKEKESHSEGIIGRNMREHKLGEDCHGGDGRAT